MSKDLIVALKTVRTKALNGELAEEWTGVCKQVADILGNSRPYSLVLWVTGTTYPIVRGPSGEKWKGKYLKARLLLIDDLIRYLEAPWWKKPFLVAWGPYQRKYYG